MSASPSRLRSPGIERGPTNPKTGEHPDNKNPTIPKASSCKPCRQSKLRCDRHLPCSTCKRSDCMISCTFESQPLKQPQNNREHVLPAKTPSLRPPVDHWIPSIVNNRAALASSNSHSTALSPVDSAQDRWDAILRRPISQMGPTLHSRVNLFGLSSGFCFSWPIGPKVETRELLAIIPASHHCEYLINYYFQHMSPLFHILHGPTFESPTFERDYRAFVQDPSKTSLSWLALFLMVLSMAVHAIDDEVALLRELCPQSLDGFKAEQIAHQYRTAALIALSMDNFLVHHDLNTLEAILLLIYAINHWEGVEYS